MPITSFYKIWFRKAYYLGFTVNSGEYKLMGLAPYGNPSSPQTIEFKKKILSELVDIMEDGSILLDMRYFDYGTRLRMTNNKKWETLFGIAQREPESSINQSHANLALAIQQVTESIVLALANTAQQLTGSANLVMAGGVALNCVANSKILEEKIFENVWVQPAAGDAGGALGAALATYHIFYEQPKKISPGFDSMKYAYLGPEYAEKDILKMINKYAAIHEHYNNFDELTAIVSSVCKKTL